jgi:hypothetical protein
MESAIRVIFYSLVNSEPTVVGFADMEDDLVKFHPEEGTDLSFISQYRVQNEDGKVVSIHDGEEFLKALPRAYSGSGFWCEVKGVDDEDDEDDEDDDEDEENETDDEDDDEEDDDDD